jgi:hypothetical protein
MSDERHRTAIVYDFDGTLARGNVQEHSFLPELGTDVGEFWAEVKAEKQRHDADEILIYMWRMLELARARNVAVTCEALKKHGAAIPLFEGVESWFGRINTYAEKRRLALEHYVVSSAIQDMIEGCAISDHLKQVYASKFVYDGEGKAIWPGVAINYTTKTQYLFRINKGVPNHWDNDRVNRWQPMNERPLPFTRMLYLGDGDTDIPSMKMVRQQGGFSVAVFDPSDWGSGKSQRKIYRLISEDRVHFVAPADYSAGSQLEVIVKGILGRFARGVGYRGNEDAV